MNDPFVSEVRQFRHEHARQFHDDLTAICDDLRDIQRTCGQTVVTFPPKRMSPQTHLREPAETVEQVAA
jgi:hypothetical protein